MGKASYQKPPWVANLHACNLQKCEGEDEFQDGRRQIRISQLLLDLARAYLHKGKRQKWTSKDTEPPVNGGFLQHEQYFCFFPDITWF